MLAHNACSRPLDWLAVVRLAVVRLVIKCGQLKPRHVSLPLDRVTKDKTNTVPPQVHCRVSRTSPPTSSRQKIIIG